MLETAGVGKTWGGEVWIGGRSHIKVRASFQTVSFKLSNNKRIIRKGKEQNHHFTFHLSLWSFPSLPSFPYTHTHSHIVYTQSHHTYHLKMFTKIHVCNNMVAYISYLGNILFQIINCVKRSLRQITTLTQKLVPGNSRFRPFTAPPPNPPCLECVLCLLFPTRSCPRTQP